MQKLLIRVAVSLMHVSGAAAGPIDSAIAALYQANDTVQAAIATDVCRNDDLIDSVAAGMALGAPAKAAYDAIRIELGKAYAETDQTDGALEQVLAAFCEASENR